MEENMPMIFKQLYPWCKFIIDCSEICIEIPTGFDARAQTYSNYKKHDTIKFLLLVAQIHSSPNVGVDVFLTKI